MKNKVNRYEDFKTNEMYNTSPEFLPQWSGLKIPKREYIDNVFDYIVDLLCEVNRISEKNFDGYDEMAKLVREFFDNSPEVIDIINNHEADARHQYCGEYIYYTYFNACGNDIISDDNSDITVFVVMEGNSEEKDANISIDTARKVSKEMREKIRPMLNSESKYTNGLFKYLTPPNGLKSKFGYLGFSADKNGFFVHTHRARTKSYDTPEQIPQSKIDFIKTTS